jgi:hypothetical protein
MVFRIIGHPDLEEQVPKVFAADPKQGPVAVARIRAPHHSVTRQLDASHRKSQRPGFVDVDGDVGRHCRRRGILISLHIERHSFGPTLLSPRCRFQLRRVLIKGFEQRAVEGRNSSAAAKGLASRSLCLALLAKVEKWPI